MPHKRGSDGRIAHHNSMIDACRRDLTLAGRPVTPLAQRTALQIVFVATAAAISFGP